MTVIAKLKYLSAMPLIKTKDNVCEVVLNILMSAIYSHSIDPLAAIQQYCDQLIRSGRTQELTQVKQYVDMTVFSGQRPTQQYNFPGQGKKK